MKNNVTVTVKEFSAPPVNMREVLRYSGGKDVENARECLKEAEDVLSYKVCYAVLDLSVENGETDFGFAKVKSLDLAKNLKECSGAVIFVATVGVGIDRLIARGTFRHLRAALFFSDGMGIFPSAAPEYDAIFVFFEGHYDDIDVPPWVKKLVLKESIDEHT